MNRLPSSSISNKSPYELLYSKTPTLDHLKVIGCLCYATVMPKGDKFSERAAPTIFLGYSELQKGYVLLDIKSKKFLLSRDVIFHENIFPFSFSSDNNKFFSIPKTYPTDLSESCDALLDNHLDVIDDHLTLSLNPQSIHPSPPIQTDVPIPPIPQRKSNRETKIPCHLKDYVLSFPNPKNNSGSNTVSNTNQNNMISNALFSKYNHTSTNVIASKGQVLVENICYDNEPHSYEEAALIPAWQKAM